MAEEFNLDGMVDMYIYENGQLLEKLEEIVLETKDDDAFDENNINEIFRIMHTIKGSSGVMMYDNIMKVSHKLEDIFYYLRENLGIDEPHMELTDIIFQVLDFINGEMDKIKDGNDPDGDNSQLIELMAGFLERLKGGNKDAKAETKPQVKAAQQQTQTEKSMGLGPNQFYIAPSSSDTAKCFRIKIMYHPDTQMSNLRAYSATFAIKEFTEDIQFSPEDILSDESISEVILAEGFHMLVRGEFTEDKLREIIDTTSEIESIDIAECTNEEFVHGFSDEPIAEQSAEQIKESEAAKAAEPQPGDYVIQKEVGKAKQITKPHKKKEHKQAFMSVSIDKMNMLMNLMGEMVIAESVVLQNPDLQVDNIDLSNFNKAASQLGKITTEMQELIMSMRMMPLTNTFQKMNRTVFDMSRKLGKDIEFEMLGDTTEVDKNIIENISDPLMHLVRNSVDHGIETPEEREAAGKTEKAKVTLEAKNEGGKVWISVSDNGKGMSRKKLYRKAWENGILPDNRPESEYTDKEIFQFITYPGFSTKEKVTEFSGRGVGMDVVVKNIQKVGGVLDIDSVEGQGSVMTMKIPLTMAIIDGIVMRNGNTKFVMETSAVKEFIRVSEEQLIHEPSGEEYIMIRGECYPVLRLSEKYHIENAVKGISEGVMLLLEYEGNKLCVLIDELIGTQEIVVKPIPSYIKKIQGISGCTQLGDGSIALILDVSGLMQS
ncbi:MAG: chemotaxis protein CheA [Lachnospiraceae bacterium]|nr:chemotaxis protein CheA [Lachnospiraceae bacterium]